VGVETKLAKSLATAEATWNKEMKASSESFRRRITTLSKAMDKKLDIQQERVQKQLDQSIATTDILREQVNSMHQSTLATYNDQLMQSYSNSMTHSNLSNPSKLSRTKKIYNYHQHMDQDKSSPHRLTEKCNHHHHQHTEQDTTRSLQDRENFRPHQDQKTPSKRLLRHHQCSS
jgi:hypothetical protein